MKVFLVNSKVFFEVNRKEELTDEMFIISDLEEKHIERALQEGEVWVSNGKLCWSDEKPTEFHKWNTENKRWEHCRDSYNCKLEEEKLKRKKEVHNYRTKLDNGGVKVGDKWYHSDLESRSKYGMYARLLESDPSMVQEWQTMDGSMVALTKELVDEILITIGRTVVYNFKISKEVIDEINSIKDLDTVTFYVFKEKEWSEIYSKGE